MGNKKIMAIDNTVIDDKKNIQDKQEETHSGIFK